MTLRIATASLFVLVASPLVSGEQSLGNLSSIEKARRAAITSPARVIRDADLPQGPDPSARPAPPSQTAPTMAPERQRVPFLPARFSQGAPPRIPMLAVAGGEVYLEISVDDKGRVTDVNPLRHTPPFTEELSQTVRGWQFQPAEDVAVRADGSLDVATRKAVDSKVLVMGLFRPPVLLGPTLGQPPRDVAPPTQAVPYPVVPATMPQFPPRALFDGVVLAEVRVGPDGEVERATTVRTSPGFEEATLDAVHALRFRPGVVNGQPTDAFVYVVVAFRQPIT